VSGAACYKLLPATSYPPHLVYTVSSTTEMMTVLSRLQRDEEDPQTWNVGPFGAFCPVHAVVKGALMLGDPQCAVAYRGHLYIMGSVASRDAFVRAPRSFAKQSFTVPSRICVVGDLGTQLAGLLAKQLQTEMDPELPVLTMSELLAASGGDIPVSGADAALELPVRHRLLGCQGISHVLIVGLHCQPSSGRA